MSTIYSNDAAERKAIRRKNIIYSLALVLLSMAAAPLLVYLQLRPYETPLRVEEGLIAFIALTFFSFGTGWVVAFISRALNLSRKIYLYKVSFYGMILTGLAVLGMIGQSLE